MRVNNTTSNQVQSSDAASTAKAKQAKKANSSEGASSSTAPVSTDAVRTEISSKAREIAAATAEAKAAPDVREEKIAELKKRIAEGKYKVDANAVADKMVREHMQTADLG